MATERSKRVEETTEGVRMNTPPEANAKVGKGSRPSVTEDEVRAACAKLISEKQTLSHRNVRAIIGRGSFSTIGRLLLEIKAKDTHTAQAPEIRELFEEMRRLAFAKAKSEVAKDTDELKVRQKGLSCRRIHRPQLALGEVDLVEVFAVVDGLPVLLEGFEKRLDGSDLSGFKERLDHAVTFRLELGDVLGVKGRDRGERRDHVADPTMRAGNILFIWFSLSVTCKRCFA